MELLIRIEDGRWTVNGKKFEDLTPNEITALDAFFENFKNG